MLKELLLCKYFDTKKLENFNTIKLKIINSSNFYNYLILIVK